MEPQTLPAVRACKRHRGRHLPRDDLFHGRTSKATRQQLPVSQWPRARRLRPSAARTLSEFPTPLRQRTFGALRRANARRP